MIAAARALPPLFLVCLAGAADALIVLHSHNLLAVYVTGNTTKVGVQLFGGTDLPRNISALLAVIATFFIALVCAAKAGSMAGRWRAPLLLMVTALFLLGASALAEPHYPVPVVMLIAAAMGTLNQVLADEPGVTFITGSLVRSARALADKDFTSAALGLMRPVCLLCGALAAAWLDARLDTWTLAVIGGTAMAGALAGAMYIQQATSAPCGQPSSS